MTKFYKIHNLTQSKTFCMAPWVHLHTTPKGLVYVFRAILYLSAVYVMAIQPNLDLPQDIQAEINKWLIIGNAVVNVTIKFFGLDFKS